MLNNDLSTELIRFVRDHPNGWGHDDWLGLLFHLAESGFETADEAAIGLALEREHLAQTLGALRIRGLGPKRVEALANHFGNLWNLKGAPPEAIGCVTGIPPSLAERVSEVFD